MSKITPGRWTLNPSGEPVISLGSKVPYAVLTPDEMYDNWKTDAAAIAKLPELIETIEGMIRLVGDDRPEASMSLGREMLDKLEGADQVECAKCGGAYDEDDTRDVHGETYCIHCLGH